MMFARRNWFRTARNVGLVGFVLTIVILTFGKNIVSAKKSDVRTELSYLAALISGSDLGYAVTNSHVPPDTLEELLEIEDPASGGSRHNRQRTLKYLTSGSDPWGYALYLRES